MLHKLKLFSKLDLHNPKLPILQLSEVTVYFNQTVALKNITFQLHQGERVAVVGPNGAGKSTLFNLIAGILPPDQGQIKVFGNEPKKHICIAYVPQRSQVDWSFPVNVMDVVMMGRVKKLGFLRWPTQKDKAYVTDCLALVGIDPLAKRQISELSGGQQQRVFIARALAQEAELMLMDEPLTGLDIQSQEAIFTILDQLHQRKITVLVSTHNLNLAVEKFDRLMLLNKRLIGFGQTDQVFTPALLSEAYGSSIHLINHNKEVLAG